MGPLNPLLAAKEFCNQNAIPLAKELLAWRATTGSGLPEDSPLIRQLATILNLGELNYPAIDALISITAVEILAEAAGDD